VPRKSSSCEFKHIAFLVVLLGVSAADRLCGAETPLDNAPKYLGATSCASSGCHGGAGRHQNQFLTWSLRDFHSQRPFATLTTARSKQIADALKINNPAADTRCTSCHSPLHDVPNALRGPGFNVTEAVSCESCHGPAEHWLRSHTRADYTHADRVGAGMRDLKQLYVRANTCVACHQNISLPLRTAGHPELIFELDGQCVSQPKHWREKTNYHGAQAWLVGQAAALREMSWQLSTSIRHQRDENLAARTDALLWLLQKAANASREVSQLAAFNTDSGYSGIHAAADKLSRAAAEANWSAEMTSSILAGLAKSAADFRAALPARQHALRAERLVLALDRLIASKPRGSAEARLNDLFKIAQSLPDFDPARFSSALDEFARSLEEYGPEK
jgi:hypothetical protein